MAYPQKRVAFSEVKRIVNEEFKVAIEDIKNPRQVSEFDKIKKEIIKRIRNLRDNLLENIEEVILWITNIKNLSA